MYQHKRSTLSLTQTQGACFFFNAAISVALNDPLNCLLKLTMRKCYGHIQKAPVSHTTFIAAWVYNVRPIHQFMAWLCLQQNLKHLFWMNSWHSDFVRMEFFIVMLSKLRLGIKSGLSRVLNAFKPQWNLFKWFHFIYAVCQLREIQRFELTSDKYHWMALGQCLCWVQWAYLHILYKRLFLHKTYFQYFIMLNLFLSSKCHDRKSDRSFEVIIYLAFYSED